jgi:hypothetical protein
MKFIRFTAYLQLFGLLPSGCHSTTNTLPVVPTRISKQLPLKSKSAQEKVSHNVDIEDLPSGEYSFCSQPPTQSVDSQQIYGWCFGFRKNGNKVAGIYTYREPIDAAQICIRGVVKDNKIKGSGYEISDAGTNPAKVTQEDLKILHRGGIWDIGFEGGKHLRISMPSLYKTGRYNDNSRNYYSWVQYQAIELNLNEFFRRDIKNFIPPVRCPPN